MTISTIEWLAEDGPGVTEDIQSYWHCKACFKELPEDESPMSYQRVQVGWTSDGGIQVWCRRHDKNVVKLYVRSSEIAHGVEDDDTITVTLTWSTRHGECEDCALPAAFYSHRYKEGDDPAKLCSICAANDAADGMKIRRIDEDKEQT